MLDKIDEKILAVVSHDSDVTAARLGERVGLSASAAHRRVKLLEAAGLIAGYRAKLSPEARGNPSIVFVSVTLRDQAQETLARFEEAIRRARDIEEAHLMTGEFDYILKVPVRADDSFERVHRDTLARLPGVLRLVSHFAIRTVIEP
ncbi:Lrp/AsnC family transcriptional regulator [Phenylobacterium sp.]|jgi:DNA-binding Lrp family transcriptional regulator|uniref:Lrp/AsnC family transcriptional regulator n=1 Tax=Phenylobacterium sp. TaxID=1871053 RepID=UPI002F42E5DF